MASPPSPPLPVCSVVVVNVPPRAAVALPEEVAGEGGTGAAPACEPTCRKKEGARSP